MNSRKGFVLVFSLLVTLILSLLLASFYTQNINENNLARHFADSTRAFWLAEAGVANAYVNFPGGASDNNFGGTNYSYNVPPSTTPIAGSTNYYTIISTGTVTHPYGTQVSRKVTATVKTGVTDPSKFKYGIETTGALKTSGGIDIVPADSWKQNSTLDFSDLFGVTKAQMQAGATHSYTDSNFGAPIDGITWVEAPLGFTIGNLPDSSGVLVINGDVHFSGNLVFDGIIYVIGKLTMTGTITASGGVLAESGAELTKLSGNVTINYDVDKITAALDPVASLTKQIVSWREI